jgi:hypothetical protein
MFPLDVRALAISTSARWRAASMTELSALFSPLISTQMAFGRPWPRLADHARHCLGLLVDHAQQDRRGALWRTSALFPIPHRFELEAELGSELCLSHF